MVEEKTLTVNNVSVHIVRKDIKNLHLGVYPPLWRVRVAVPRHISDESVRLFVISKISWIRKNKKKFAEQQREFPREYISGESHYFMGKRYLLQVSDYDGYGKIAIRNKKYLDMYISKDAPIQDKKKLIYKWYRKEFKNIIPDLIHKREQQLGVKASEVKVKQMKTKRWSCNHKAKRLWLNIELIKKPLPQIEYVILHELAHLIERTHNDTFKQILDDHMPWWRLIKEELNQSVLVHEEW